MAKTTKKEQPKGLSFICKKCKAKNDISVNLNFDVGGFKCKSCNHDNHVRKADL